MTGADEEGYNPGVERKPFTFAVLTPPGQGGVASVGILGAAAGAFVEARVRSVRTGEAVRPEAGRLIHVEIEDGRGEVIDQGVLAAHSPAAFEFHIHGAPFAVERLLLALEKAGGVPGADPAVFGPHAPSVPSGIDPSPAAMALALLLESRSRTAAAHLLAQARGALARALAEASGREPLREAARASLRRALETRNYARRLVAPASVVLAGPRNAGKSTLFNALLGRPRNLVSPVPGTTRDAVEEPAVLVALPARLTDTAGLGVPGDPIEREGMGRARRAAMGADLVLWLAEAGRAEPVPDLLAGLCVLPVFAKRDLAPSFQAPPGAVALCALTGEGIPALRRAAEARLAPGPIPAVGAPLLLDDAQEAAVRKILEGGSDHVVSAGVSG